MFIGVVEIILLFLERFLILYFVIINFLGILVSLYDMYFSLDGLRVIKWIYCC